jgi:hypothetical protein
MTAIMRRAGCRAAAPPRRRTERGEPARRATLDVTKARWFLPSDLREVIRANARVVVRVDPDDAKAVLIDWDQTRVAMGLPPSSA